MDAIGFTFSTRNCMKYYCKEEPITAAKL